MSHPHLFDSRDTRSALVTALGADFQSAVAPFKAEIAAAAQLLQGDLHRAAMRLLVERQGRRTTAMEQQLIVAALAELQDAAGPAGGADVLSRVAERLNRYCDALSAAERAATKAKPLSRLTAVVKPAPEAGCAAATPAP